ncbi:MAG: AAA family ATPase, partial [bacterium]
SKGYRQRVGLAQALIHDPDLIILDEPTSGLDPLQIREIRSLIKELGKEKTVILSTHILAEVEASCDRIILIHRGSIIADDAMESVIQRAGGDKPSLENAFVKMIDEAESAAAEDEDEE